MAKFLKKSNSMKKEAKAQIDDLMLTATKVFPKDKKLADRYVEISRKISMKYKTPIPKQFKKRICKNCKSFLYPGINCRVRVYRNKLIYFCMECKSYMRMQLDKGNVKKKKHP